MNDQYLLSVCKQLQEQTIETSQSQSLTHIVSTIIKLDLWVFFCFVWQLRHLVYNLNSQRFSARPLEKMQLLFAPFSIVNICI